MTEVCVLTTKNSLASLWYITSSLCFLFAGSAPWCTHSSPFCGQARRAMTNDFGFCLTHLGNGLQNHTSWRKKNLILSYLFHQRRGAAISSLRSSSSPSTVHQQKPLISSHLGIKHWEKGGLLTGKTLTTRSGKGCRCLQAFGPQERSPDPEVVSLDILYYGVTGLHPGSRNKCAAGEPLPPSQEEGLRMQGCLRLPTHGNFILFCSKPMLFPIIQTGDGGMNG